MLVLPKLSVTVTEPPAVTVIVSLPSVPTWIVPASPFEGAAGEDAPEAVVVVAAVVTLATVMSTSLPSPPA